jgi:hypothetical protein
LARDGNCTNNPDNLVTRPYLPRIYRLTPTVFAVRRLLIPITALALALSACASPETAETSSTVENGVTDTSRAPSGSSSLPEDTTTTTSAAIATTSSDRPLAPDFTLQLGEGGTYTLSEGSKPVYLVFWAEW